MRTLRPSPRAITDGSPDPVPVKVWLGPAIGTMILHVDPASARGFARYKWLRSPVTAVVRALGHPVRAGDIGLPGSPARLPLLATSAASLIGALYSAFLIPRTLPRPTRNTDKIRINEVDDTAAQEWQSANAAGVITVKPNTPRRDMLVGHRLPSVLRLVLLAVALLL